MFDRELIKLIGGSRRYIVYTVLLMVLGMAANIGITASICWAVSLLIEGSAPFLYVYPAAAMAAAIVVRYLASRCTGRFKDALGRKVKKDLRGRTYDKILRLGVRSTSGMSMAGLTQVSMEGVEQLDLYYSSYLPQFFFSMIAPLLLFAVCVWIDWRTSLVLLACVPLIPVSIVAVSKYAKRIFAKYWGKYTSMGDMFLDSVQGLKELKIFKADGAQTLVGAAEKTALASETEDAEDEKKIFRKYKIKDIVFLAIMAACMLVTGAIMPLVGQIPVFGIIQICLGLQFSIFPVIGMMKVRKPFALLFMSVCCGVVLAFMNTVMFVCLLLCAAVTEALVLLLFRGDRRDGACLFAGTLCFPLTLPFLYVYYQFFYAWTGEEGQAVSAFVGSSAGMAVGMSVAVVAVCFVGALLGVILARELKKSGVLKK